MSEYLSEQGLTLYDSQIKAYIGAVSGSSTGVRIVTLNSAPVSGANGTHQYTIDGTTYEFKAGDEVRVQDGDDQDTNDYQIYKLYDRIDSENTVTVYWGLSGSSGEIDDIVETCIINLSTTNHTYDPELIGATITFTIGGQDTTKTWNGNPISMKILTGTTYSVTIGNVTGFTTPSSGISERVAVSGNTQEVNAIYTYRPISLTVGTNQGSLADLISANAYVTINGVQFDINNNQSSTQTFITHVTTDNLSVPFVFSSVTGYTSPIIVDDGSQNSFNVTYNTTVVTCTAMVDPAAGKSSNDVIFIVSSDSISSTNVSSGGTIKIPTGEVITITSTDLSSFGYSHNISPVSGTTASGTSMSFTATYQTETLTIQTINVDEGSVSGATFTVNGISKVYGTDTLVWHLPYGVSDIITHDISGYSVTITKNPNTDVADSASKIVTIDCAIQVVEIKAIDSSGNEVSYDNATSSCVGVVVRDMDKGVEFFIDKRWSNGSAAGAGYNNYKSFSPALYNNDPSTATDGRQLIYHGADYGTGSGATADNYRELGAPVNLRTWAFQNHSDGHTGAHNTNIFVNSSLVYSETTTNNASKFCRSLANPITGLYDGFLGNDAEWIVVHDNLEDVNNMLTKIGGTSFSKTMSGDTYTRLWSSNEYSSNYAWGWYWISSYSYPYMYYYNKSSANQNLCAVPFFPVISEVTQIKVLCSDGTEISPSEVNTSTPSNYVGVIVRNISNNINFIIGKTFTKGSAASASANNYKSWYSSNISGGTTTVNSTGAGSGSNDASTYKLTGVPSTLRAWSLKAHNMGESGIQNTRKIISTLSSGTTTNCAAKFCNTQTLTVNGVTKNGYLGSLAEWIYIHDNFEAINSALSSIGGTPLNVDTSGYNSSGTKYSLFWTSTEYSSYNAWRWSWYSSYSYPYMNYNFKSSASQYYCAVPFFPIDSNN